MSPNAEESFHPLLPRLKKDGEVTAFARAGQWMKRGPTELQKLSVSLKVDKMEFLVNSIPDIWARPILFEMALYDRDYLLHERVRGEWRGLLAMLALKERKSLSKLGVVQVEVPLPDPTKGAKPPGFLDALGKLMPKKTLSSDTSWEKLYVIVFNNKPIGMMSPTTLVCTATDYYDRIHGVTWFDGRYLHDPVDKLNASEKEALASWLDQLRKALSKHPGLDRKTLEWISLLRQFKGFITDLDGAPQTAVALSPIGFQMSEGIFRRLNRPLRREKPIPEESCVRLRPSRKPEPTLTLLVVDKAIPSQWNRSAKEITVFGDATLADFPYSGLGTDRSTYGRFQVPSDMKLRLPEDFFTERLFVIEVEDAFPGALKPHGSGLLRQGEQTLTPILPIRKELLDYLTIDDLEQRIFFEQGPDGITVRVQLPLSGFGEKGEVFEIEKEYKFKDQQVVTRSNVPVLEVWPNFRTKNWKAYHTYYSSGGERAETMFYAKPYAPGGEPTVRCFRNSRKERTCEITRTDRFPEAMVCEAQIPNTRTKAMEPVAAGVILIRQPEPIPTDVTGHKIGIDFGTTSTNAYAREGENDPVPVVFENRFLQVTASGPRRVRLYEEFIPGVREETPFLSFFQVFPGEKDLKDMRPLFDGHVYFLDKGKKLEDVDLDRLSVASDLKWSLEPIDRIRSTAFLGQVCLQCAAEVAARGAKYVSWRYSYPSAFSDEKKKIGFPEMWRSITKSCHEATGLAASQELLPMTESVASAVFFAVRQDANVATGAVCIDIGGGTSDIAVWQDNNMCCQTSLRFAGRDIFLSLLRKKPTFLNIFGESTSHLEKLKGSRIGFYAKADAVVNREGDSWLALLPKFGGNPEVQKFTQLIALGLSGLFHYIGLLLQYLVKAGRYEKRIPDVYVGGNGAKMFHWLAAGSYTRESPTRHLFKDILLKSSGFQGDPGSFSVTISENPKAEAAYGLVSEKALDVGKDYGDVVLAGEVFLEDNEPQNWDVPLTAEKLKKGLRVPEKLEQLESFVKGFNEYARSRKGIVSPINVDKREWGELRKRVIGALADFSKKKVEAISVEPLFLIALKKLLQLETEKWAEKRP